MLTERMDSNAFREFEHAGWQRAANQYHDSFGSLTAQTIPVLLDAVHVTPSTYLLDVASGPGYVALAAAKRGAQVVAIDFSSAMVSKAKALFPDIDFREGDAEALSFPTNTFNAVVMNFGLLHLGQPEKAIAEACRVLHPGGRFGFTVWANIEESIGFQIPLRAIQAKGNADVPLPSGPPFFRFSDKEECKTVLTKAGFIQPAFSKIHLTWKIESSEDLYVAFYDGSVRTGGLMRAQSADALSAIKNDIQHAVQRYKTSHGSFEIPMAALVVSAEKP